MPRPRRPRTHLVLPLALLVGGAVAASAAAAPLTLQSVRVDRTGMLYPQAWTIPDAGGSASFAPRQGTATYAFPMPLSIPDSGISLTITAEAEAEAAQSSRMAATIGVDGDIVKGGPVVASAQAAPGSTDRDVQTVRLVRGPLGVAIVRLALLDGPRYTYTYTGAGMIPNITCGAGASAAAVTVDCLQDDVAYHKRGRPPNEWLRLYETTVLGVGDQVSAGADGLVTLVFPNKTTLVLEHNTQVQVVSANSVLLGMGEAVATAGVKGLRLKTPSYTATAKAARFGAFYDPGSKSGLVSTKLGTATVDPAAPGLKTTKVGSRREVEVTPKSISRLAPTGRAGARGGLNRARALDLVARVVSRFNGPCNARTLHANGTAVTPASGGWHVIVKLAGGLKGSAAWTVRARRATAANAVATKLIGGCK